MNIYENILLVIIGFMVTILWVLFAIPGVLLGLLVTDKKSWKRG